DVGVRLEDRADQRGILLVERLLDAAQDLLQSGAVHFDELRRLHPSATGRKDGLCRPFPGAGVRSQVGSSGATPPRSRKGPSGPGQAGGPTGRQSATVPVRVGSPAESRTASWCAASRCAPPCAAEGHHGKRLWQSQNPWPSYMSTFSAVALRLRKTKTAPANGSCRRASWQSCARPSIPRRKSAGSTATRTFIWGVIWNITGRPRSRATAPRCR